ncbi:MAG TPA: potassium channel family protein [Terriglobales bacterium]
MNVLSVIAGVAVVLLVLLDAFESVVLPRRVRRSFRVSSWYYRRSWRNWSFVARHIQAPSRREAMLGYFGPLSLLILLGLWAVGLILGFALIQYGAGDHITLNNQPVTFGLLLYHSGETFYTLGYGDVVPSSPLSRTLSVFEAGMGFAFLGVVIGYLPTIYAAFSIREIEISLFDARAGSPPTAYELLSRYGKNANQQVLDQMLRGWEQWSARLLESHLSYPPLAFFRSQHNNQSWLGALTVMLDTSSLIIAGIDGVALDQARLTFAMARHAVVDLAQVANAKFDPDAPDRLPEEEMALMRRKLQERGLQLHDGEEAETKLESLRVMYEPYAQAIAQTLLITLPPWIRVDKTRDNWLAGPWDRLIQAKGLGESAHVKHVAQPVEDHF